jgi:hypothetical protein
MNFNMIPMRWQWKRLGHMAYRCGKGINQSMSHVVIRQCILNFWYWKFLKSTQDLVNKIEIKKTHSLMSKYSERAVMFIHNENV